MKKIIYAMLATISGLVLILSYRTSLDVVTPVAATDTAPDASGPSSAATPAPTSATTAPSPSSDTSDSSTDQSATPSPDTSTTDPTAGSSSATSNGTTSAITAGLVDGTYSGGAASTRYGPVQVQITVSGGQIVDVQVPEYPNSDRRDQQINERAIPTLMSETTQAQSAQIDMVSGATFTSKGYITSLQSAIDLAQS